ILFSAMKGNHLNIIQTLLKKLTFAGKVFDHEKNDVTALMWAATHGHIEIIQALLSAKVNLNFKDKRGRTALHWAVINHFANVVRALLKAKANPNVEDNQNNTPLMHAAATDQFNVVWTLWRQGAVLRFQSTVHAEKALVWAATSGRLDIVKVLCET